MIDHEAPGRPRTQLIRGIATALTALGLAIAVAPAAPARPDATGGTSSASTWAEPRIGSNHNQVLI